MTLCGFFMVDADLFQTFMSDAICWFFE